MSTHSTTAVAQWRGDIGGTGTVQSNSFTSEISVPAGMSGRGTGTNTEDLLTSAAATCMSITLGLTFTRLKIGFDSLRVRTTAQVEFDKGLRLLNLVHEVEVVNAKLAELSAEQREEILKVATSVEKSCFVSRAVSGNADVVVKPTIVAA